MAENNQDQAIECAMRRDINEWSKNSLWMVRWYHGVVSACETITKLLENKKSIKEAKSIVAHFMKEAQASATEYEDRHRQRFMTEQGIEECKRQWREQHAKHVTANGDNVPSANCGKPTE